MRVKVLGAYTMKGIGSKSGKPYDMCQLIIETKQESVANPNMQRVGFGLDSKDLNMDHTAFERLTRSGVVCPFMADLEVGSTVGFRGLEAIITGVNPVQMKAAA